MLLQFGQLLSSAGTQSSMIAYPLLVLAVTHSAAKTGTVAFARLLPAALLALPAGLPADRWNRNRIAITPDRLLGRSESVRGAIALSISPLGPLAAGALLGAVSARTTIAVFAVSAFVLAVWGTLSPAIRAAPGLEELGVATARA
jgi:hypothetical protein